MTFAIPELFVLAGIIGLIGLECWLALKARSWIEVYRPTLFVAVVLAFYALVGPIRAIFSSGEPMNFIGTSGTIYRHLDHRPFLFWGWLGAFAFYGFLLLGFYAFRYRLTPGSRIAKTNLNKINRLGQGLCWIGLVPYSLVNGGYLLNRLNPFANGLNAPFMGWNGLDVAPFDNYFYLAINLLIPGIVIQFAVWLRRRKSLWVVLCWLAIALPIFLSEAFRYRLLLLVFPLILLWFFYCKRRPMLVMLLISMTQFIGLSGTITVARTTMRGLDVDQILSRSPAEIFTASFEEAGVFFTTSAVIKKFPSQFDFIGFEPVVTAILQPVPRSLLKSKPSGSYSRDIPDEIYNLGYKTHAVFLGYGEYYIMFGWPSLVAMSFFLGASLRYLWTWFLWHQYEPLAQCVYLLNSSYLYVVVSRGYLSQVIMLYCFTVFPAVMLYFLTSRFKRRQPSLADGRIGAD